MLILLEGKSELCFLVSSDAELADSLNELLEVYLAVSILKSISYFFVKIKLYNM